MKAHNIHSEPKVPKVVLIFPSHFPRSGCIVEPNWFIRAHLLCVCWGVHILCACTEYEGFIRNCFCHVPYHCPRLVTLCRCDWAWCRNHSENPGTWKTAKKKRNKEKTIQSYIFKAFFNSKKVIFFLPAYRSPSFIATHHSFPLYLSATASSHLMPAVCWPDQ